MAKEKAGGGKKNRKLGRDKLRCNLYRVRHTREKNKLRRVLQSSGLSAAHAYASQHALASTLSALLARKNQTP